jgi:hypothetical protein
MNVVYEPRRRDYAAWTLAILLTMMVVAPAYAKKFPEGPCETCTPGCVVTDPSLAGEGALPPAMIIERTPCVYKPYDLDPCYNLRCDLNPGPPPSWLWVQADLAPLFRDTAQDVSYQRVGAPGPVVLGTQTIDLEFQGGLRFLVGGRINDIYSIETSFTGFQHWEDSDAIRDFSVNNFGGQGNLFSPFANFGDPLLDLDGLPIGILGLDFNNFAQVAIDTSYDSVESNFMVEMPRIRNLDSAVSLGVRYVEIDEAFAYQSASFVPAGGATVGIRNNVDNEMIGVQLGYRARFLIEPRAWLDFDVRGALYQNRVEHVLQYRQTQAGVQVGAFDGADADEQTSYGGDLSLVMHYLVTPNVTVRLGYQAMLFDSVALAAENMVPAGVQVAAPAGGPNTLVYPPLEIDHTGEVVYHGPVVGVMGMW